MEKNWQPQNLQEAKTQIYLRDDFEVGGQKDAERLKKYVTVDSVVLDVGCGIGRIIKWLAPFVRELYGVDSSEQMLKLAIQKYLPNFSNVTLYLDSAENLRFHNDTFDFVYSVLTLQHISKSATQLAVKEMVRVTKPGGRVLFDLANVNHPYHAGSLKNAGPKPSGSCPPMQYHDIEQAKSLIAFPGVRIESLTAALQIEVVIIKEAVA